MNKSAPTAKCVNSRQPRRKKPPTTQETAITLTRREKEILVWGAKGKSSWEIGKILSCTESGVNYHFDNIRRKFGVTSRWVAAFKALEQGLIQLN